MGTALLALCFCALLLVLALFVGISPISDKAKIRFMYVGAALSLMAVSMMSHYIAGLNNIVDELRYQAVLVFIVVVCCYCFVIANMVKYNVMKKKVAVLEDTVEKLEQERAAAMSQAVDEEAAAQSARSTRLVCSENKRVQQRRTRDHKRLCHCLCRARPDSNT